LSGGEAHGVEKEAGGHNAEKYHVKPTEWWEEAIP
jgi:hypothetical protein